MRKQRETSGTIPLVEEKLSIEKRTAETGRVRVRTRVGEKLERVSGDLEHDDVSVERVAINREVTEAPQTREENGVLIIPVLEEIIVVEKRLLLKEEIHVRRERKRERVEQAVRVRHMEVDVERTAAPPVGEQSGSEPDRIRLRPQRLHRKDRLGRTNK
jgi:uncharacterized protein (TIGR02271 family)